MRADKIKTFYRLKLPHIQPIGLSFFVTFRLKGSIPKVKLKELAQDFEYKKNILLRKKILKENQLLLNEHKRFFVKYDQLLDTIKGGPHYLREAEIASIVATQLHRHDGTLYDLIAYTIMSNHVHLLIDTSIQLTDEMHILDLGQIEFEPLEVIMKKIKGASARFANIKLGRTGMPFWEKESYDHYIRNEREFNNIIAYILNNPLNAGIVKDWEDYPFSYLKNQ